MTPTMQDHYKLALFAAKQATGLRKKLLDDAPHDPFDVCVQSALIALSESVTGKHVDYVCTTGEILEDVVKDMLPAFELEPCESSTDRGAQEWLEVAWSGSGIVVVDATAMPPEYIDRKYRIDNDRAEITAICTKEEVNGKLLVTIEYEGVACG